MWVVVKFVEDVSAVLLSWIKIDETTGETLCFWPRKNAIKKRAKPNVSDLADGTYYPCRILMDGAQFSTLKKALEMEIRGQNHSSAETTNDEGKKKKRKRTPNKKFVPEEGTKKKRKITKKPVPRAVVTSDETSCESSDDTLSDPMEASEYTFKKSKTIHMQQDIDTVISKSRIMPGNSKSITVIDVVTIVPPNQDQSNVNLKHSDVNASSTNVCVASADIIECENVISNSDAFDVPKVGDIIDFPFISHKPESTTMDSQSIPNNTLMESILNELTHVNAKLDTLTTTLNLVALKQEGFKSVIVDLTSKILRLEERVELKQIQKLTLSQELSLSIKCPDSFNLNETALLAKKTTAENLVAHICSVNFQSELEPFIKSTFIILFELSFFYKKIIWSHEPGRIYIKETEVMQCIARSIKGRFPALKKTATELDAIIYTVGKKLKDSYRKRPENKSATNEEGVQEITKKN